MSKELSSMGSDPHGHTIVCENGKSPAPAMIARWGVKFILLRIGYNGVKGYEKRGNHKSY